MEEKNIRKQIFDKYKINQNSENEKYELYFETNDIEDLNQKLEEKIENEHPLIYKFDESKKYKYEIVKLEYKEYVQNFIEYSKYLMLEKMINRRFRYVKKNNIELNLSNVWTEDEVLVWNESIENIDNFKNALERQLMRKFTVKQQMEYFNEIFSDDLKEKQKNQKLKESEYTIRQEVENKINYYDSNNVNISDYGSEKYQIDNEFKIMKNENISDNQNLQDDFIKKIQNNNMQNNFGSWNEYFQPITTNQIIHNMNNLTNHQNLSLDELEKKRNEDLEKSLTDMMNLNNNNNNNLNTFNSTDTYFPWTN